MNSRERVLKAFGKMEGKPDRVPIQFDLCRQLSDHFGKKLNIPVNYTENLYEDVTYRISANEIRTAMGSDVVITGASVSDDYKIEKISVLGKGGGYMISPAHIIQNDVSPQRVELFIELCLKHGRY